MAQGTVPPVPNMAQKTRRDRCTRIVAGLYKKPFDVHPAIIAGSTVRCVRTGLRVVCAKAERKVYPAEVKRQPVKLTAVGKESEREVLVRVELSGLSGQDRCVRVRSWNHHTLRQSLKSHVSREGIAGLTESDAMLSGRVASRFSTTVKRIVCRHAKSEPDITYRTQQQTACLNVLVLAMHKVYVVGAQSQIKD